MRQDQCLPRRCERGHAMNDLIEALTILSKYATEGRPTHCEHDVMMIACVDPTVVSEEDKARLDKLGFFHSTNDECFISFRFGSA